MGRRIRRGVGEEEGSRHSPSSSSVAEDAGGIVVVIAAECRAELRISDPRLQPRVEARPAVEVAAPRDNGLVGHDIEADGAEEPPVAGVLLVFVVIVVVDVHPGPWLCPRG